MLTNKQEVLFIKRISDYANTLKLPLSESQITCLVNYLALFIKWNKVYNLSAIRDPEEMFVKHLLDSLSIAPLINGERFIDVGTGGGLPGVILAICFPSKHFTLLDSAGKKTRFLVQVKQALQLTNIQVENTRVESFKPSQPYCAVISRAFASLHDFLTLCQHLILPNGRYYAMKGVEPASEIKSLASPYQLDAIYTLNVPDLQANRCLLELSLAQSLTTEA